MLTHFKPLKSRSETSWICLFGGMDSLVNRYAKTKKVIVIKSEQKRRKLSPSTSKMVGWFIMFIP
jgi:hypothetical protein